MANYYPDAPIRRFWFMRGRLARDAEFLPPPGTERGDMALLEEQHARWIADAGEPEITSEETGAKGFVYGSDPIVKTATIRWSDGALSGAREALLEWSRTEGWQLGFDSTWKQDA